MVDYRIKLADSANERDQIYALNYATFVEEIPQHGPNPERRLIDRFDAENEYVVAIDGEGAVVGMLALRANRPFSLDQKLRDLDHYLPPHRSVCEIRLLAVRPSQRNRRIFRDLVAFSARRCIDAGHDLAVISGTTRQLALYGHLGFEPFGPPVGTEAARYQPMFLSIEQFRSSLGDTLAVSRCDEIQGARASFFTGPVTSAPNVRTALGALPLSHRAPEFVTLLASVRAKICVLTGAADAVVLSGTGTLANGEFGERLVDHARRAGLRFETLRHPWGKPFDGGEVREALQRSNAGWLWAVHCETSTGILNDLDMLRSVAAAAGAEVLLDCISSIGTVPVALAGVRFASCVSGKGLGGYPGLSMVLVDSSPLRRTPSVPRYLDLALWLDRASVPFTHSSNLVAALDVALSLGDWPARLRRTARHGCDTSFGSAACGWSRRKRMRAPA